MWLLNVKTMELEAFLGDIPRYSILSHCWGREEVSFQDITSGDFQHLEGYQKIAGCCKLSRREGFEYTWIDTCCIDKSSSAELTEAINSMFTWYKDSSICYTYMEDVGNEDPRDPGSPFARSKWFMRGWTLQELIAPDVVVFLSSTWRELGTRGDLAKTISTITGINLELLLPNGRTLGISSVLRGYSIACKMSWAAKRRTTRIEDIAYCLMGLFDINMPLLYGEGDKAFIRLQKEIINSSNDFSILAWDEPSSKGWSKTRGILAPSPSVFENCRDISPIDHDILSQPIFEVYKSDIRMQVPIIEPSSRKQYLNLSMRLMHTSPQPFHDVRSFLQRFISGNRGAIRGAFIALIPCAKDDELIGLLLSKPDRRPPERCGRVSFLRAIRDPPGLSIIQVPITYNSDVDDIISFGTTIQLASNCFRSESENIISLLSNSETVAEPTTLFLRTGKTGSLSIKLIDSHQPCPEFVVVLECRAGFEILGNCVAIPDTHTSREVLKNAYKRLQSSKDTNEVRVPLTGMYEAVVKFRVGRPEYEILVGVEEVVVDG